MSNDARGFAGLEDSGCVIIIVPYRGGLWSRIDDFPLRSGLPYTPTQLDQLLRDLVFMPLKVTHALFTTSSISRPVLACSSTWENTGPCIFYRFSGVLIVQAGKWLYAGAHLLAGK